LFELPRWPVYTILLIGENGVNLSEGQRQRLSIARALVKDPDILVLDEPTSALDSLTEKSIFNLLPELVRDKTLFVASNRLSTIEDSDRILVLNENRLVATGTHQSLMGTYDYYRSLVTHQHFSPKTEPSQVKQRVYINPNIEIRNPWPRPEFYSLSSIA